MHAFNMSQVSFRGNGTGVLDQSSASSGDKQRRISILTEPAECTMRAARKVTSESAIEELRDFVLSHGVFTAAIRPGRSA